MSSFSRAVAHSLVHQRRLWLVALAVAVVAALSTLVLRLRLDSEILNLLPSGFDTVESLKIYSSQFSKNRELTFALYDQTGQADLDGFSEHFATALAREPWVRRFLDRSPLDQADGTADAQALALPLLFNLPGPDFDAAIAGLQPTALAARLRQQRETIDAGSPRAEIQLTLDPLGLVAPAMQPLTASFSMDKTQPLASADGTMHLVLVRTDQIGDGPAECRAMMEKVNAFNQRVLQSWPGPGSAPQILVTGRTPYVAQLSKDMERDIISTLVGSVLLVAGVFYYGFRRVRPLVAIILVLFLCCLFAIALGSLCFPALNSVTIGFCSILIGLGVDFGMLLYGSYQTARDSGRNHEEAIAAAIAQIGRGVFFGALTTAAGFLALLLSDCAGFAQLGVLIALGILLAAALMMTAFFLFISPVHRPQQNDRLAALLQSYLAYLYRAPRGVMTGCLVLLTGLTIFAVLPVLPLRIEPNPRSLEPKNVPAGYALRKIQEKMTPSGDEPVLAILNAPDDREFQRRAEVADAHWRKLVAAGQLKSATSPAMFVLSPDRLRENTARLAALDFPAIRQALDAALAREGFSPPAFAGAFRTLDQLQKVARTGPSALAFRAIVPENSSWWFILDKYFGAQPRLACAYLTPLHRIATPQDKAAFLALVTPPDTPVHLTGWTFTMADLVVWAQGKLILLSAVMVFFNLGLLIFLYRRFTPLFLLMLGLLLSLGAMVATIKITGLPINLFNILAFPLVLGVGVDYGIYVLLAVRQPGDQLAILRGILKPVLLSAFTAAAGFGSLGFAENPSLSGLGLLCAIGVGWSIFATLFFLVPAYIWKNHPAAPCANASLSAP